MFDLSKLPDVSKIAGQAKKIQEEQNAFQKESLVLLKQISEKLDGLITLVKGKQC